MSVPGGEVSACASVAPPPESWLPLSAGGGEESPGAPSVDGGAESPGGVEESFEGGAEESLGGIDGPESTVGVVVGGGDESWLLPLDPLSLPVDVDPASELPAPEPAPGSGFTSGSVPVPEQPATARAVAIENAKADIRMVVLPISAACTPPGQQFVPKVARVSFAMLVPPASAIRRRPAKIPDEPSNLCRQTWRICHWRTIPVTRARAEECRDVLGELRDSLWTRVSARRVGEETSRA
jgi:hypothetical protein